MRQNIIIKIKVNTKVNNLAHLCQLIYNFLTIQYYGYIHIILKLLASFEMVDFIHIRITVLAACWLTLLTFCYASLDYTFLRLTRPSRRELLKIDLFKVSSWKENFEEWLVQNSIGYV